MQRLISVLVAALLVLAATPSAGQDEGPAEVMLFGVFHFSSPGHDKVKTEHLDVMADESQAYLLGLAERISAFKPTVVLLEFNPEKEAELQEKYEQYRNGTLELPVNEIYQLGFRVAALSDVDEVYSFDERKIGWNAEPLFEYMPEHDQKAEAAFNDIIEEMGAKDQKAHDTLSLKQLLQRTNDPERDRSNKYLYLYTNPVGDENTFVGADAAASWWHRNFRMYARIQRHAAPGERVLVIGGQGHIAILRDMLDDDLGRKAIDVRPYL